MKRLLFVTVAMFVSLLAGAMLAFDGAKPHSAVWPLACCDQAVQPVDDGRIIQSESDFHSVVSIGMSDLHTGKECHIDGKQSCPLQCGMILAAKYPLVHRTSTVGVPNLMAVADGTVAARLLRPPISRT